MREHLWFNLVAVVLIAAVTVFATAMVLFPGASPAPPTARHGTATAATVYRELAITFNPKTGTFDYSTLQLSIPLGVTVVFTVVNHDASVGGLPTPADARVAGTVGGSEVVSSAGVSSTVSALSTNDVSHTFSVSSAYYHVNAPIPSAASAAAPAQATFSVVFDVPGTFTWGCVILCGPSDMTTMDAMFGTLTVS